MTTVNIAEDRLYRVLQHHTGDREIQGIENIRPDISHTFTSQEAAATGKILEQYCATGPSARETINRPWVRLW